MTYQSSLRTFGSPWTAANPVQWRRRASGNRKNIPLGIAVAFGVSISGWTLIGLVVSSLI